VKLEAAEGSWHTMPILGGTHETKGVGLADDRVIVSNAGGADALQ